MELVKLALLRQLGSRSKFDGPDEKEDKEHREPRPPRTIPLPQGVGVHGKREKFLGDEELLKHWLRRKASMSPNQLNAWSFVTQFLSMISSAYGSSILILDSVITPSVSYTRIRATNPRPSPRRSPSTSTAQSILSQRHSAYMEFTCQQLFDWNQRVAGVTEHNSRMTQLMFASMATGQIPTMEPPPPPPRPQPVLPTFEQFLAEHYNGTPGTGGSSAGGGATDGSTPESRSPVTPVWRGPGGGGGGGGSASASGDDLGFGDLGFGSGSDAV